MRLAFTKIQEAALLRWEGVFEFEFNNQIYDVLRQSPKGDSTIYWCWPDQQETELEHHLDDLVKKACNQDPERQDAKDEVADFFEMLYCYPTWRIETNLSRPFQTFSALKSRIEDQFWQSTFLQGPPSPPPQSI